MHKSDDLLTDEYIKFYIAITYSPIDSQEIGNVNYYKIE